MPDSHLVRLSHFLANCRCNFMITAQTGHLYCTLHALQYCISNAKGSAHVEIDVSGWRFSLFSEALPSQDWLSSTLWCPGTNDLNSELKPVPCCQKKNKRSAKLKKYLLTTISMTSFSSQLLLREIFFIILVSA